MIVDNFFIDLWHYKTIKQLNNLTPSRLKNINTMASYMTNVYYDILDDDDCLWTIYRFTTKEVAEQFIKEVPFVCSEVDYDPMERADDGHTDKYPYRPIFTTIEDAMEDAKEFHKYGDDKEYKYHGRVFREDLSVIERQHHINTIKQLRLENEELKAKVESLRIKKT